MRPAKVLRVGTENHLPDVNRIGKDAEISDDRPVQWLKELRGQNALQYKNREAGRLKNRGQRSYGNCGGKQLVQDVWNQNKCDAGQNAFPFRPI